MTEKAGQHDYWDRHAGTSNLPDGEQLTATGWPDEIAFYLTPEQDYAYDAMRPLEGRHILELGCGVGVNAINLGCEGASVFALDASHERLKVLADVVSDLGRPARVFPVCATAENLPFREGAFDAVYTKSSLIHTDLETAMTECRRVLRAGGRGVFCEPTTSNPFVWLYRRFLGPKEWKSITRYFSRREERVFTAVFGNLSFASFFFISFLAFYWQFGRRHLKRFRRWLAFFHPIDRFLFAICPPLKRLAWFRVYVVKKREAD